MTLGFLGTGTITSAMVTGLHEAASGYSIRVSPRNPAVAADLANRFADVSVASSNQAVLDECETVIVAVRPQIAREVLAELHFRADHHVISVVAGYSVRRIEGLVAPATRVARAIPLPFAARRRSPTAIYPHDPVAAEVFAQLGAALEIDSEDRFSALSAATATMATYFAMADSMASWMVGCGISPAFARDYVARVHSGLAQTALEQPERTFQQLAVDHATRGGTNEQIRNHVTEAGVFDRITEALDAVLRRVTAASQG